MTSNPERDLNTYLAADVAHSDRDASEPSLNRVTSAQETTGATPTPLATSDDRRRAYAEACGLYSWHRTTAHFRQTVDAVLALADRERAHVWDVAYGTGVADAWQSFDYDHGQTPAARVNPYNPAVPIGGNHE